MNTLEKRFDEIKQRIREEISAEDSIKITPRPLSSQSTTKDPSPVQYSDELHYLNLNWGNWSAPTQFCSHRSIFGKFIVLFKRKIQQFLFNSILKDYFENERTFNSNLVRFCNDSSRYIDARDKKLFWDLIEKIDSERATTDIRNDSLYHALIEEIKLLNHQISDLEQDSSRKISVLEDKIRLLESKISN